MRYSPLLILSILTLTGCSTLTEPPRSYENTDTSIPHTSTNTLPYMKPYEKGMDEHEYKYHQTWSNMNNGAQPEDVN